MIFFGATDPSIVVFPHASAQSPSSVFPNSATAKRQQAPLRAPSPSPI
eukprot:CAMPEP_0173117814 /NCGR_PEP_ID=MMETSP1102-20130122/50567_1 /TAXON_ID=49646 /ORGANISM="Geminigera sp., Strain Caron Lab Isolate" /LENGTH=47 /DNA_ID= /DNA_START= /DNA_END= /DNA_ORIENTATION=